MIIPQEDFLLKKAERGGNEGEGVDILTKVKKY